MKITPSVGRRNVFLDIETVSIDAEDAKGALSALTGRIVCVCLLFDDGSSITEEALVDQDEAGILRRFWTLIRPTDVLIGHNVLDFDLPFIRQRCWILGIKPSRRVDLKRYYTQEVIDTMQLWSNWGSCKYAGLDKIAIALGCGGKSGKGTDVAEWWQGGQVDEISRYCALDVRLSFEVFCRMMFQPLPERYTTLKGFEDTATIS